MEADGAEEVVFVSVWRDLEALYAWVGGTDLLDTPVLSNGRPEIIEHFEVQHYVTYETAEPTPADLPAPASASATTLARASGSARF
jgi:hypothetical protein